jgi:hypothetical protein
MGDGSREVFFIGSDRLIHEFWAWSDCRALTPGSPGAAFDGWHYTPVSRANRNRAPQARSDSTLAGFRDATAKIDAVFFVDDIGHVQELLFTPQANWTSLDLTQATRAEPAAGTALGSSHFPCNDIR